MKTRMRQLLLPVLLALMMPQATRADGINEKYNYLVTMVGLDQLKIQMPVYDEDGYDGWIDKGYIYVTPAGGIKYTLLYFYCEEKSGAEPLLSKGREWCDDADPWRQRCSDGDHREAEL